MKDTVDTPNGLPFGRNSSQVSVTLRARICSDKYAKGDFLPTVREIGKEFSVSSGTVCRALKTLVAEGMVVAKPRHGYEVVYQPAKAKEKSTPICLILRMKDDYGNPQRISEMLLSSVQQAAAQQGWSLLSIDYMGRSPEQIVKEMKAAGVWGAIIDSYNPEIVRRTQAAGITVVAIDAWHPDLGVDAIVQDDFHGGFLAAEYLVGRGHERVAWFGQVVETEHAVSRFGGALAALSGRNRKAWPDVVIEEDAILAGPRVREILAASDRPTGWLALWRDQALNVLKVARELGLQPARDFDLVGWCTEEQYEDSVAAMLDPQWVPPMVVWDMEAMTRTATIRLAERQANRNLPPMRINISTRLKLPPMAEVRKQEALVKEEA